MSHTEATLRRPEHNGTPSTPPRRVYMPRTDIAESAEALVVFADMPGVDEQAIDITLEKDVLTLRGRIAAPEFSGLRLTLEEYALGNYERAFVIGNDIDRDGISASVKDGVLKVVLPKARQSRAQKIEVKAAQ